MTDQADPLTLKVLDAARRKLLETGTRNRLIHVNRQNQRSTCLNILDEKADAVFDLLRDQGKRMRFKAMGKDRRAPEPALGAGPEPAPPLALAPHQTFDTTSDTTSDSTSDSGRPAVLDSAFALTIYQPPADEAAHEAAQDAAQDPGQSERFSDLFLQTPLGPEAQARRLLRLALDARTAEEEQGLNILFLAMGFLKWRETGSSEVWREAPLLLIPVELLRNARTSTYDLRAREDDITTNLPLQERLRQDFGLVLPDVEEAEGWRPSAYMARVAEVTQAQPGWSVDGDGMQLGFFSFAKLLMHRDLEPASWPAGHLTENPLLSGLLSAGFDGGTALFGPQDRLDELLDPADLIQVVDADASQTKVIEEVRRGANLVVQGPPGTGKSQTITNLIAAAAHDGKTVLFVAEKMAALSVVHQRLVRAGLRDICLELHSRSANKKALAQELGRTLTASAAILPAAPDAGALRQDRDHLNRISALLHSPFGPEGDTPFAAMAEIIGMIGKGARPPVIALEGLAALGAGSRARAVQAIGRFAAALDRIGAPEDHPFRGTRAHDLQPTDLARLQDELTAARAALADLGPVAAEAARRMGFAPPTSLAETQGLILTLTCLSSAPAQAKLLLSQAFFDRVGQARLGLALSAGARCAAAITAAEGRFVDGALGADLTALRSAIAGGQASLWARMIGPYRKASADLAGLLAGPLPKTAVERLGLVDQLAQIQRLARALAEEEAWLEAALGENWQGAGSDFAGFQSLADWLAQMKLAGFASAAQIRQALQAIPAPADLAHRLASLARAAHERGQKPVTRLDLDLAQADLAPRLEEADLDDLGQAFADMQAFAGTYADWSDLARSTEQVVQAGAGDVVDAVAEGRVAAAAAVDEFIYACAEARWTAARQALPELARLSALDRHALVARFQGLERDRFSAAQTLIRERHFARIPRGSQGEMGVIRSEIGRKSRHKPIRWLMRNAGAMVQRIKPVMLMSPISVAQFLPPGGVTFDLLVIDEASQIRPEDALGVIARARQIVVVGDQKQLPPTSFFDRLVDEDQADEDDTEGQAAAPQAAQAADMESILSLCEARGLRTRMLEWHYRSRHPSLIRVSNAEFYEDRLILPPSPLQMDPDYGLKFHRVPGVYARGKTAEDRASTNRIEAGHVVRAMARHARSNPDLSLGVVAFSKAQTDMLTEILDQERRQDPALDAFLREGRGEDVFVKNIENVQGDERDVILISVGYGPQVPDGRLTSMSFGPINGEGGERRLNVLFSRARVRCEVFASFDPGDIDPGRTLRDGPRVLKRFLDFARTGLVEERVATGLAPDSPFEEDVIGVIRDLGYEADPQVGTAGFRIDIGVRHPDRPGQYLLAVECDGAAYHAALWARERDRLRQEVLESQGWQFHRIWSTDWFHRREAEAQRLAEALARARAGAGIVVRGANAGIGQAGLGQAGSGQAGEVSPAPPLPNTPVAPIEIGHLALTAPAYRRAAVRAPDLGEPHEAPQAVIAALIGQIVAIEGPIHVEELTRRIAQAFGKAKVGARITEATLRALDTATRRSDLVLEGAFVLTGAQSVRPPLRDRRAETGSLLKAEYLPPMEIAAAVAHIRAESGAMPAEEMTRAVARLLGYQRVGAELAERILAVVEAG